jgi:predicted nucleotide-binding protein (sugar kinase/HSP70/actin superfamily)
MAYDRLPLWRCFFEAMGTEVVVSPQTSETMLASGVERQVVETCLPVKAFCAHLRWLEEHENCDFAFVPSLISTGVDRHGKETVQCPFVQSVAQFARPATTLPLLNPVISWRWHPEDEQRSMIGVAAQIGINRDTAQSAWQQAIEAQSRFRKDVQMLGRQVLADLASGKLKRAFVLLGKDYNVCDSHLNSGIAEIFATRGECVITQDMLADDSGSYSPAYRTMYWSHSKEMLAAAEIAARTRGLFAVVVTSFGCGPDSFTARFVADTMGDKPMLFLEVDEHSSPVGMETRIEAFLDGLPGAPSIRSGNGRSATTQPQGIRRVYLPNFSDHALAFVAAVQAMGLEAVLTEAPDDATAQAGVKHCNAGECHPFALLLGGYIRAAEAERGQTGACYLIPESNLCLLGQFGTQMRLVADEKGLTLPVYTRFEELAEVGSSGLIQAGIRYWQTLRGMDFLLQKFFDTRAREITPGTTDRVYAEARHVLHEAILQGKIRDGLLGALHALESIPIDTTRRLVKIGITGDLFTRICDYANADIFRDIERMGGTVLLPPTLSELVIYDAQQKLTAARERKSLQSTAISWATQATLTKAERSIRKIFGDSISYDVPLDYKHGMKLAVPYIDAKMPSGLTGSVASILEQIHAGADGILSLITLHCSYGLVLNSVLASIDRDFPEIPKLALIFEGLKPTHNLTRLEAFMERVRNK